VKFSKINGLRLQKDRRYLAVPPLCPSAPPSGLSLPQGERREHFGDEGINFF